MTSHPQKKAPVNNRNLSDDAANVARLTLAFAKAVGNQQTDKADNLLVSPYNAATALAIVAKGARGATRDEMSQSLFATDGAGLDAAAESLAALNADILAANAGKVTLRTANAVWTNKDLLTLCDAYAEGVKQTFGADISGEDFSLPGTVGKMNQWASDNTNGLINKIIDQLSPDAFAIIASALYFKGKWTHKFDENLTSDQPFTSDQGQTFTTAMMTQFMTKGRATYQDAGDYEAVALTYGEENRKEGKTPSMRIVLIRPKDDKVAARDWLSAQDGAAVPEWMDQASFAHIAGTIELPRLDIKQRHDLIPALEETGMKKVFDASASDLSGMIKEKNERLFVNKVTHDIAFMANEESCEGAAITTVGVMRATSAHRPEPTFHVKLDRSFVFMVQDIKTGTPLFLGAVNKPNGNTSPAAKKSGRKPGI